MKNNRIHTTILSILLVTSILMSSGIHTYAAVDPLKIAAEAQAEVANESESNEPLDDEDLWTVIEISSADELMEIANKCSLDTWSRDKYVKLISDISLTGTAFTYFPTFGGVFDGNGHKISGLNIRDHASYIGFISKLQPGAVVKNLKIEGSVSPSDKQFVVGGFVGDNYGTVENCIFDGRVEGNDYTGGIAGYNEITGIIINCKTYGSVSGKHYTGGIVGTNCGGVYRCGNNADVSTVNIDKGVSIDDINLYQYIGGLLDFSGESEESKALDKTNSPIDVGGVVGHSTGVVEFCNNTGTVGYEHVGYNIGGIVGRQSGYVHSCTNAGNVYGRKDVGGIVGQAEPFVQVELTEDIVYKLTENINDLHDLIEDTLDDSDNTSDTVSNRLNVVQQFVNGALQDTDYISNETISFVNGVMGAGNEAMGRADYAVDEASKSGGAIDKSKDAFDDVSRAADDLEKAVGAADVESRMSEEDKTQYNQASDNLKAAKDRYKGLYDSVYTNNYYYYINTLNDDDKSYHNQHLSVDDSNKLVAYKSDDTPAGDFPYHENDTNECVIAYILHGDGSPFPATEGDHVSIDADLILDASVKAENMSRIYAGSEYPTFLEDVAFYSSEMSTIIAPYAKDAENESLQNLKNASENLENASENLTEAAEKSSNLFNDLNGRADITLPTLGSEYSLHTNSFIENLQGMSDNLGFLNQEMNVGNDVLIKDMDQVNDKFNAIMLLFTDALDGALDGDYGDVYEDDSVNECETSTDGTIADCKNNGKIEADIDVAGVAGTMAIEYDFDLEGEVSGGDDTRINSIFKTKCVLRNNINNGRITAQKSYVGGNVGLQELGTVINSDNYGIIASNTGSYVGGIAGNSTSRISNCRSMGILSGEDYIGGIAGYGHEIYESYALISIDQAESFYGAIAGEVDDNASLRGNVFVSENLAGVDRISYAGLAQPVEYSMLKSQGGFDQVTVTFRISDDVIGTRKVPYAGSLTEEQYPEPVAEADYYIDWDCTMLHDIKSDMEVVGEPARYRTTLASNQLRTNKQSVLLVDGRFKDSQSMKVTEGNLEEVAIEGAVECWKVMIPEDNSSEYQIRLQLPENVKKADIYTVSDENYVKLDTEIMGMYYLFTVSENDTTIVIVDKSLPLWLRKIIKR